MTELLPVRQVTEQFARRKKQLIVLVVLGGLIYLIMWLSCRDQLPPTIRIATGSEGGLYHVIGTDLATRMTAETAHETKVVGTSGSLENLDLLYHDDPDYRAHLAIVQAGTDIPTVSGPWTPNPAMHAEGTQLMALAPLYDEWILVIARTDRGIESVGDLRGKRVAIGAPKSGMRHSAEVVLDHYGIPVEDLANSDPNEVYNFADLKKADSGIDAAIVTSGVRNQALRELMKTGQFKLVPIEQAEAIDLNNACLFPVKVPAGALGSRWDKETGTLILVPAVEVQTVSTTAVLVTREDTPNRLVEAALAGLYDHAPEVFRAHNLKVKKEAMQWHDLTLHPAAENYYDPLAGIGIMANYMESISGVKELIFGLVIIGIMAWRYWNWLQRRGKEAELRVQHRELDKLIDQTLIIERSQAALVDPIALRAAVDRVLAIKLDGIEALTHEDLRSDRRFVIFLLQCSYLIHEIHRRIATLATGQTDRPSNTHHQHHQRPFDQLPDLERSGTDNGESGWPLILPTGEPPTPREITGIRLRRDATNRLTREATGRIVRDSPATPVHPHHVAPPPTATNGADELLGVAPLGNGLETGIEVVVGDAAAVPDALRPPIAVRQSRGRSVGLDTNWRHRQLRRH